jgi:hypothetical protein
MSLGWGFTMLGMGFFSPASCCCIAIGARNLIMCYTNLSAEISLSKNSVANDDDFSMLDQDSLNSLSGKFFSHRSIGYGAGVAS